MMGLRWRRVQKLVVSSGDFEDLRFVAKHVLQGMGLLTRLLHVKIIRTLLKPLDDHLLSLSEPRSLIMIVHGDGGRLVGGQGKDGTRLLVDNDWFGVYDQFLDVFALGCETAGFFDQYRLARRCTNFIGYAGKVQFFIGSALAERAAKDALARIGNCVAHATILDKKLIGALTAEYVAVMKKLNETPARPVDQTRLTLALLEAQIQDLRAFEGGQA
jgi:hypothetical protein